MYLLTFTIEGELILSSTPNNKIAAFHTLKDVLGAFEGYIEAYKRDYESATSATIGLMNIQPKAVEYNEVGEALRPYLLSDKTSEWNGILGASKVTGTPIKPEFLEGKQVIEMWGEIMMAAGIKDPIDSIIAEPFNFTL